VSISICGFLCSQRAVSLSDTEGEKKKKAVTSREQSVKDSPDMRIICDARHISATYPESFERIFFISFFPFFKFNFSVIL